MIRRSVIPLVLAATAFSGIAQAQQASPITGNIMLASEYRFRGIDQTFGKPALQGGFDYAHPSGFYLGNWNSNVSEGAGFPGASLEMDFYGGFKPSFGDLGLDVGFVYYAYPGSDAGATTLFSPFNLRHGTTHSGAVNNKEFYAGATWKWLTAKWFYSLGDYFSAPGTKGSNYLDLGLTFDMGGGWAANAHYGHLNFKDIDNGSYSDWKLGVTKDVSGWVFGAAYIGTNAKGDCGAGEFYCFGNASATKFKDAGRSALVLSVAKTF